MSQNSNYIQSRESQIQINETCKKKFKFASDGNWNVYVKYVCSMLFSLGALMNVFDDREGGTSSLGAKSVL